MAGGSDDSDGDWEREAAALRPHSRAVRTIWTALAVNALVALIFLGGPYLRGRWRATDGEHRFARFAGCLWGAEPTSSPGLGLPPEEELHFADRMLHGDRRWPTRCRDALERLRPEPARFLFPSVKQAEELVRRAVTRVEQELSRVQRLRSRPRGLTYVPLVLHARVLRLMAALSYRAKAAGADSNLIAPAIRFVHRPTLVRPTRVPLQVSADAWLDMRVRGDGLLARAMDRRVITRVEVAAGGMTLQRIHRPPLVQGLVPGPRGRPWLVWATPDTRCADEPDRCAGRATGVARLDPDDTRPPAPTWLAAHPDGAVRRSVAVRAADSGTADVVDVIARGIEGGAEVRRFRLEAPPKVPPGTPASTPPTPAVPTRTWPLRPFERGDAATLLDGVPARVAWATSERGEPELRMRALTDGSDTGSRLAIAGLSVVGNEPAWLMPCTAGRVDWLAVGRGSWVQVVRSSGGRLQAVGDPFSRSGVGEGSSRVACDDERLVIAWTSPDRRLEARVCRKGHGCGPTRQVAERARYLAVGRERGVTYFAYAAAPERQVRLAVLRDTAGSAETVQIVAPCFGADGGLCGAPALASSNGRVLLGARERGDLLVVETTDGGRSWRPMRGLR